MGSLLSVVRLMMTSATLLALLPHLQSYAGGALQVGGKLLGYRLRLYIVVGDGCNLVQVERCAASLRKAIGIGYDGILSATKGRFTFGEEGHRGIGVAALIELYVIAQSHTAPAVERLSRIRLGAYHVVGAAGRD